MIKEKLDPYGPLHSSYRYGCCTLSQKRLLDGWMTTFNLKDSYSILCVRPPSVAVAPHRPIVDSN
jgi:hypothetical protein